MKKLTGWKIGVAALCLATAIAHAQTVQTLVNFDKSDGAFALGPLQQGRDGNLYGVAGAGGRGPCDPYGCGTVFKMSASGSLTTLHIFCSEHDCTDGAAPGPLTLSEDGNFYGFTGYGGNQSCLPGFGCGTIFRITPNGNFQVVYDFCGNSCGNGRAPLGNLVLTDNGYLYGNTSQTAFRISQKGDFTTLCSTCPGGSDINALMQATDGNFYGTANSGGAHNFGTVFRMTPVGNVAIVHSFDGSDGCAPNAGVIEGTDGNLYGTTTFCGANNAGTIFSINPSGNFATLYNFCSQPQCGDGLQPSYALFQASDGNLYGTDQGQDYPGTCGQIFRFTPGGTFTTLYTFNCTDGDHPLGPLSQATSGILYGTTEEGGEYNYGTIFSLDLGFAPFVAFVQSSGKVGQTGGILGQGFTGATSVMLNGVLANFTVVSDTYLTATVPQGATTGYVTVNTSTGVLTSNVPFRVIQ